MQGPRRSRRSFASTDAGLGVAATLEFEQARGPCHRFA